MLTRIGINMSTVQYNVDRQSQSWPTTLMWIKVAFWMSSWSSYMKKSDQWPLVNRFYNRTWGGGRRKDEGYSKQKAWPHSGHSLEGSVTQVANNNNTWPLESYLRCPSSDLCVHTASWRLGGWVGFGSFWRRHVYDVTPIRLIIVHVQTFCVCVVCSIFE